jgi:hypothetical protein
MFSIFIQTDLTPLASDPDRADDPLLHLLWAKGLENLLDICTKIGTIDAWEYQPLYEWYFTGRKPGMSLSENG